MADEKKGAVIECKIEDKIADKIEKQYLRCSNINSKLLLKVVIGCILMIGSILGGIVAWSYKPVSTISVLEREMVIMNEKVRAIDTTVERMDGKLDVLLGSEGLKKHRILSEKSDNNSDEKSTDYVDYLTLACPALGALCQSK